MTGALPSTVIHPDAFKRNRAAGSDGDFHWECIIAWEREFDPASKITPMDIDACIERKGHVLHWETKDHGVKVPPAQIRALRAQTWPRPNGTTRTIVVWGGKTPEGQAGPLEWQHIADYGCLSHKRACVLADIRIFYLVWRHCAEANDMSKLRDAYQSARVRWHQPSTGGLRTARPQRVLESLSRQFELRLWK
jgi:hypothetical protein